MKRNKRYSEGSAEQGGFFLRTLQPKNDVQKFYLDTMREATITFGLGPAGTGKTFLAVYSALEKLLNKEVDKIILTRPIVAVEDIGYLPGTMDEKIHPYMLPLLDSLEILLGTVKTREFIEKGTIEINPLAYMRGRSLNKCVVIADEMQNSTREQMKMFLTRIGYEAQYIITGDPGQSDIPNPTSNGLSWATSKLKGVDPEISVVEFKQKNIVRNPLIGTMLTHLEGPDQKKEVLFEAKAVAGGAALLSSHFGALPDDKGLD